MVSREDMHKAVDTLFDMLEDVKNVVVEAKPVENTAAPQVPAGVEVVEAKPTVEKPKDSRVVRTKSSGDRVYLLSIKEDGKKTRQWVYNPEVLESLGFNMGDVVEIEDSELLTHSMGAPILKPVVKDGSVPKA